MTTLYQKIGRRYVPVSTRWNDDSDQMKVGQFRLTYCYTKGGCKYEYNVTPATASWKAAAMVAREAMEKAIQEKSVARPHQSLPYTRRQVVIINRFRKEMKEAGGLLPHWWEHTSAYELSEAAVKAVEEYRP